MKTLGHIVPDLLTRLSAVKSGPLNIVETGTSYLPEREEAERDHEHRSTIAIAEWIAKTGIRHSFYSLDSEAHHIEVCRESLQRAGVLDHAHHLLGTASESLTQFRLPWDFVLLDSDSDPNPILKEFQQVRVSLREPSIVVIDDIGRNGIDKGGLVLPLVRSWGIKVFMVERYVAAIGFGTQAVKVLEEYR